MATFYETVLPSGKGIRLERLTTKEYRKAQERAGNKAGLTSDTKLGMALTTEMLLSSFRAITHSPMEWKFDDKGEPDVDAMLAGLPDGSWVKPTYENLIVDGPMNLETLLDDPMDYNTAIMMVQDITLPNRDRAGSLAGKRRMVSVGQ